MKTNHQLRKEFKKEYGTAWICVHSNELWKWIEKTTTQTLKEVELAHEPIDDLLKRIKKHDYKKYKDQFQFDVGYYKAVEDQQTKHKELLKKL